jgi:putative ABC transport system permease protein
VSVALEPPRTTPVVTRAPNGGAPARRAVVRWSWRLFRREWRQQLLVLALLTMAVAATTAGLAVAVNATSPGETRITLPGSDPRLGDDIVALRQAYGPVTVAHHQRITVPGSVSRVDLRAQDHTGNHPTLRLRSGRFPAAANEVALTDGVSRLLDLRVGGTWHEGGRALRVVGVVENPRNLDDDFALVAPGQAEPAASVTVTLDHNPGRLRSVWVPSGTPLGISAESPTAKEAAAAVVLALGAIGLLLVGLVAVAGFTVMAQRRLRALGMLGSIGATDGHVRLVMLANGAAVGIVAAAGGALVGVVGWLAVASPLENLAGHRIDRFALPWPAIAGAVVLAVLTAIVAAWWPARSVSRVSVVAALSGRPPRPQPAHRFAASGGALLAAGIVLIALSHERQHVFVLAGTVLTTVGILLLAPLAVRVLGAVASRARVGVRLALRDLSRFQARSGAALGAITLAIGIAATIAVAASATHVPSDDTAGNLASNQLVVHLSPNGDDGLIPDISTAQLQASQQRVDQIAASLHTRDVVTLEAAVNPSASAQIRPDAGPDGGQGGAIAAALVGITNEAHGQTIKRVAGVYVATPALLTRFGIRADEISTNTDLLTSRRQLKGLKLSYGFRDELTPTTQTASLPHYTSAPNTLITTSAVQRLGLQPKPASWLVQTSRPLTSAQLHTVRNLAAGVGLNVETRTQRRSHAQLGHDATAAGILLALGILAMTVGLIRSETAHDLRTLTATGASRGTRRTITAATAGALALLGGVIGTGGAYLALTAWYRSELDALTHVPVLDVVALTLGLPLVAAVGGWLVSGREPPAIARQPLE